MKTICISNFVIIKNTFIEYNKFKKINKNE